MGTELDRFKSGDKGVLAKEGVVGAETGGRVETVGGGMDVVGFC